MLYPELYPRLSVNTLLIPPRFFLGASQNGVTVLTGAVMGLVGKRWHAEENKNLSTLLHYKD
jgi:hypothetical protein